MKVDKENIAWAKERLLQFALWRYFPNNEQDLETRAKAFLRLVHNKTVREILAERCVPGIEVEYKIDPDLNDADWILDMIAETMESFPLPAQMREMYTAKLPPATSFGE